MSFDTALGLFVGFVIGLQIGLFIEDRGNYTTCLERGHSVQECKEIVK
jgi:hypothetical protein